MQEVSTCSYAKNTALACNIKHSISMFYEEVIFSVN